MKTTLIVLGTFLVLCMVGFSCEKKDDVDPRLKDPTFYFPINREYKWTYVTLNTSCQISEDSFSISADTRNTRDLPGIGIKSGWDMVSSTGGITFRYHEGDTIFTIDIGSTTLPAKVLVGPIEQGTFWKDTVGYEYVITGFEDIYSDASGGFYKGCARIRRTITGDPKKTDFWWAPQVGKVKRMETNQGGQCVSGDELRRLDKSPEFP